MFQYDTVSEAVNGLKKRGYDIDFNIHPDFIICNANSISLRPSEFEITEVHRFEGPSDPADEAIVYAIESVHGHKGILVNGYGASADELNRQMIEKLKLNPLEENGGWH